MIYMLSELSASVCFRSFVSATRTSEPLVRGGNIPSDRPDRVPGPRCPSQKFTPQTLSYCDSGSILRLFLGIAESTERRNPVLDLLVTAAIGTMFFIFQMDRSNLGAAQITGFVNKFCD